MQRRQRQSKSDNSFLRVSKYHCRSQRFFSFANRTQEKLSALYEKIETVDYSLISIVFHAAW